VRKKGGEVIIKNLDAIKLDKKGRLFLSREDRTALGDKVVISKRKECLVLASEEEWQQRADEKLAGLKGTKLRKMRRALFSSAFIQTINKEGIILIPKELRREVRNAPI